MQADSKSGPLYSMYFVCERRRTIQFSYNHNPRSGGFDRLSCLSVNCILHSCVLEEVLWRVISSEGGFLCFQC